MPTAPRPPCPVCRRAGPCGCAALRSRAHDARRGSSASRGYGAEWRAVRAEHLAAEPACRECGAPGTDVDHIVPRSRGGSDGHANLQTLCHACHSRKTATRDGGYGRRGPWQVWRGRVLVAMMGAPGSGKSTLAATLGLPVASTDALRGADPDARMVDEVYGAAFGEARLALMAGGGVVLDTPLHSRRVRDKVIGLCRAMHARAVVVVMDTPADVCVARQVGRDRPVPEAVVRAMHADIAAQTGGLTTEGWSEVLRAAHGHVGDNAFPPSPQTVAPDKRARPQFATSGRDA